MKTPMPQLKFKHLLKFLFLFLAFSHSPLRSQNLDDLYFGTDSTLDLVTWNIEWFPKSGQTTIEYVKEIILAMDADVIALQEMDIKSSFVQLRDELEGYDGVYVNSTYLELAYLFKSEVIQFKSVNEIYTGDLRVFPRSPYVMEFIYENQDYVIINNHLKCCGDGILDQNNPYDEEKRRYDACVQLEDYINSFHQDDKVILLGDLNDLLTDDPENNVFQVFLDDPSNYNFTDMGIAEGSSASWSYPSWPSHLDHIMITNELFEVFEKPGSEILTIKIDDYLQGGWNEYDQEVSDHRPVGLKLYTREPSAITDMEKADLTFYNYPNPFSEETTFVFDAVPENTAITIMNPEGRIVSSISVEKGSSSATWSISNLPEGIYYARMHSDYGLSTKLFVVK